MYSSVRRITALVLMFSAPTYAYERDFLDLSLDRLQVEKITISSAFPEQLLDSSASVSLIDYKQWNQYGSKNALSVLNHMPSTMVYSTLGSGAIAIRGYAAGFSTVRGVATLLDGIPLNTLQFGAAQYDKPSLALETLDRVELIRGPGSSLYGSDAFHGVFASSSFVAAGDQLDTSIDIDSRGYYQAGLRAGQQMGEHQLSVSFSGNGQSAQDRAYTYTDPVTGKKASGDYDYRYDSQSLSVNLKSELSGSPWFYNVGFYANNHNGDDFSGTGQLFSSSAQRDRDHIDLDSEFSMLRASLGYQLAGGIKAELEQYYWQSRLDHQSDFRRVASQQGIQLTRDNEHRKGVRLKFRHNSQRFNTDWQLELHHDKTTIDDNINRLVGVDGSVIRSTVTESEGKSRTTKSLIAQAKTWFADGRFGVLYGGRLDNYSDSENRQTPRLGLIYRPNNESSLKWLYGRAFRAPTRAELNGVGVISGAGNLKAETIDTHELIYMIQREQWRLETVLFYSQWKDTIVSQVGGVFANVDDSEAQGLEIIAEGRFAQWFWRSSVSYTKSENTSVDKEYTLFPKLIANADIGYRIPSRNVAVTLSNRVHYDVDDGPETGVITNTDQLPHYWRTDLQLSKQVSDSTLIAVTIVNLFDRENYMPSVWNAENGLKAEPMSVELSWKKNFF